MNKIFFFLVLILAPIKLLVAQSYIFYWNKTYGGNSRDWNSRTIQNTAGQLFIIGDSQTDINGDKNLPLCNPDSVDNADIWLVKIDTSGNILWQKNYGAESDERNPVLYPINDAAQHMIMGCQSSSDTACDKTESNRDTIPFITADYWICLLDSGGNILWDKTLGGDNFDDYVQISSLPNSEILINGESNSPVSGDKTVPNYSLGNDLWTVKLSSTGNIIWNQVYGGTGAEFLSSVISLPDNSFILAGSTGSDPGGDVSETNRGITDYWMIKIDNSGNKVWDHRYGGSSAERCNYAYLTDDGGFILCGYTLSPISGEVSESPKGLQDYWIIKTDSLGSKQWDKRFGGNNGSFATCIKPAPGGGYWLAGYSNSDNIIDVSEPSYGGSDYWLLRLDGAGNKVWDKRFGGNQDEFSSTFEILSDSALVMCGYSDSGYSATKTAPSKGWWDYWAVKFKYVPLGIGIDEVFSQQLYFTAHPNPGNGQFILLSFDQNDLYGEIFLIDALGKKLIHKKNLNLNNLRIDYSGYPGGIYFLYIKSTSVVQQIRLVKI